MKISREILETTIKEELCKNLYEGSCEEHRAALREVAPGLFQGTPANDELSKKRVIELEEAEVITELCGPICKFKKLMTRKATSAMKPATSALDKAKP
mgnify:CR=1 FL=1